jgi:predicted RNA-binding protein
MQDVIWLEPTEDGFTMRTFFGEPMTIKGKLKGIDLLKHRVLLTSKDQEPQGEKS